MPKQQKQINLTKDDPILRIFIITFSKKDDTL